MTVVLISASYFIHTGSKYLIFDSAIDIPISHKLINTIYYMPSTFYIVKLPLAFCNIFHWTESILAQSHDGAKNP